MPNKSKKSTLKIVVTAIIASIVVAMIGYVIWDVLAKGPVTKWFDDRDGIVNWVKSLGPLGIGAYILLQISQTIVAPIPGNIVGGLGGYLFGWWGVIFTSIGAAIGAFVVFYISRRFGRRLVERFVKKEHLEKFDFVFGDRAGTILFLIYLIPGLPDDIVCYIAGLTKVPLKNLVVLFTIGRLPSVIVNNFLGAGLEQGHVGLVFGVSAVAVVLLAIIYWQQDRIIKLLGATSHSINEIEKLKRENKKLKSDIEDLADDGKINQSNKGGKTK